MLKPQLFFSLTSAACIAAWRRRHGNAPENAAEYRARNLDLFVVRNQHGVLFRLLLGYGPLLLDLPRAPLFFRRLDRILLFVGYNFRLELVVRNILQLRARLESRHRVLDGFLLVYRFCARHAYLPGDRYLRASGASRFATRGGIANKVLDPRGSFIAGRGISQRPAGRRTRRLRADPRGALVWEADPDPRRGKSCAVRCLDARRSE